MKNVLAIAAVSVAAFSGAASAMTQDTPVNASELAVYAPNVDISTLSDAQINAAINAIHAGDSAGETRGLVQALLK